MDNILDNFEEEPNSRLKNRHGCVSAWLVIIIIANILKGASYLIVSRIDFSSIDFKANSLPVLLLLGVLSFLNVGFAVQLLNWNKKGFYGFVVTAIILFATKTMLGIDSWESISGFLGLVILYVVFHIQGDNGHAAWDDLA